MIDTKTLVLVLVALLLAPAAASQTPEEAPAQPGSHPMTVEIAAPQQVGPPVSLPEAAQEARDRVAGNISIAQASVNNLSRLQRGIGSLPPFLRNRVSLQQAVDRSNRSLAQAQEALENVSVGGNQTNVSGRLREAQENAVQARQAAERGLEQARAQLDRVLERNISAAREALQQARERLERAEGRLGEEQLRRARQTLEAAEGNISTAESERERMNETEKATELVASTQEASSSIDRATRNLRSTETLISAASEHPPLLNVVVAVVSAGTVFGFLYYRIWRREEEQEDESED